MRRRSGCCWRAARTTIRNHTQETALDLALRDGAEAIAGLIRSRDEADADRIRALPLMAAVKAGDLAEGERLIAAGVSLDERMPVVGGHDDDYTPLGLASRDGHTEIVRSLLDAGADPRRTFAYALAGVRTSRGPESGCAAVAAAGVVRLLAGRLRLACLRSTAERARSVDDADRRTRHPIHGVPFCRRERASDAPAESPSCVRSAAAP